MKLLIISPVAACTVVMVHVIKGRQYGHTQRRMPAPQSQTLRDGA
jgi:hypothetical protein